MNNACFINTDVPNTQRDEMACAQWLTEYLFMHHNATDNVTYRYMTHRTDGLNVALMIFTATCRSNYKYGQMFESLGRSCSFSQNVKNIPLALEAGRR